MKVELALVSLFVASILASTESLESDNLASASEAASQPSNTQPQASNWLPYWLRWDNIPYKSQAESVSKIEDTGMTAENTLAAAEASSLSWYSSWRSCTNLWYGSVASPLDEMPEVKEEKEEKSKLVGQDANTSEALKKRRLAIEYFENQAASTPSIDFRPVSLDGLNRLSTSRFQVQIEERQKQAMLMNALVGELKSKQQKPTVNDGNGSNSWANLSSFSGQEPMLALEYHPEKKITEDHVAVN